MATAGTRDDINILLLGESGVGKSTFINSFLNYLRFDTFEDACEKYHHVHCAIPTKFTIIDDQFNERIIQESSNDNESNVAGESATLGTKSYVVQVPKYNRSLRLIDTPGIGDTCGILQDEKNQRNIINYLSTIDYINAICVLLKPNQARCTIQFQYCISQLLLYLHKTAVDNILFVFTHTSCTFFNPGETIHPLRKMLKEIEEQQNIKVTISKENSFSVDNESFHYLLARKHNIVLGNEKVFSNSFAHTRTEFLRLLDLAANIKPYPVSKTLYLYKTREKFEDVCNLLTNTLNILKSNSTLLKKLHSADSSCNTDKKDRDHQVQEIEGKLSKHESEKHNLNLQISKFLTYLRTNSIILFNDYCQEYVNYLIDREMSMGVMADKKCIRDYRILISYYEDMKRIINSNVHIEEALLVLSREELSSIFPVLEEVIVDNSRYENEVFLDEIETIDVEDQNDSDTESVPDSFTFLDFCESLNDSVNDHNKSSIEPQKLKKTNVKPEHVNMNPFSRDNKQGKRLHNHNKVPFRTQPDHLNLSKTASEASSGTRGFPAQRNHNRPKKTNLRENCSTFLDNPYDKFDYVTLDDALFIDRTRQNKQESGFRGRSRGRGRGQVYIRQTRRKGNHHNANFNKQFDIKMKSQENKPVEEDKLPPKNLFQSMKDIFD